MWNERSSPSLTNVTFTGNTAFVGGGMYNTAGSNPTLTNVTFRDNNVMGNGRGGGMYNTAGSNPTLTDVTFRDNSAGRDGGGMCNWTESSPTLTNVNFSGNHAKYGGGMYNRDKSNPTLTDVDFSNNDADQDGGGMYNDGSRPTLTNSIFIGNMANFGGGMYNKISSNPELTNVTFGFNAAVADGGGMWNDDSSPRLTNVTFLANAAGTDGGGMRNKPGSDPTLNNVTFAVNSAKYGGGLSNDNSSPTLNNTILWGNTADIGPQMRNANSSNPHIHYSLVQGGCPTGAICDHLIDSNPLFVGSPWYLHLRPSSPAIDAGNNNFVPAEVTTDLDGNPRINNDIVDMGAYEFWALDALFTATPVTGTVPLTVTFTDLSVGSPIISWAWDFGDGDTSTAQHPSHTYVAAGSYTVSLTVSNDLNIDTLTRMNYITATPAEAATLTLTAAETRLSFNGQTTIVALVQDESAQPVEGTTVECSSDLGSVSPVSGTTNASGIVTATFMAGTQVGTATVTAQANGLIASLEIEVVASDNCQIYAVHDAGVDNSQLFAIDFIHLIETISSFGPDYPGTDIEGLGRDPFSGILYGVSGLDNHADSVLYQIDTNGELMLIGPIHDAAGNGFREVASLAFHQDDSLWGFARLGDESRRAPGYARVWTTDYNCDRI
ncbi:PKD domain-containing protein [Chloroflexota bacterium]